MPTNLNTHLLACHPTWGSRGLLPAVRKNSINNEIARFIRKDMLLIGIVLGEGLRITWLNWSHNITFPRCTTISTHIVQLYDATQDNIKITPKDKTLAIATVRLDVNGPTCSCDKSALYLRPMGTWQLTSVYWGVQRKPHSCKCFRKYLQHARWIWHLPWSSCNRCHRQCSELYLFNYFQRQDGGKFEKISNSEENRDWMLNKAAFLEPQFSRLVHLSSEQRIHSNTLYVIWNSLKLDLNFSDLSLFLFWCWLTFHF